MKVVVADRNLLPHRDAVEAGMPDGTVVSWHERFDEDALVADLADADIHVGGKVTDAMARAGTRLRLVQVVGAGVDNVARASLPSTTVVANTFHHEDSIAEYVLAAAILLRRGFLDQDRALRQGVWATSVYDQALPQPHATAGARVGFVGFGHIGQRSWSLLRTLGCVGAAVTGRGAVDVVAHGLDWAGSTDELDRLADESDIMVVSAPLTTATSGMIGPAQLRALGPRGVLINVGRGPLVQERPLYEALSRGDLGAAAIDVWYDYPGPDGHGEPSAHPFGALPNVLMTPHSSGITRRTFDGRCRDVLENIRRIADGVDVKNPVT
ncbi:MULTISPECIES: 2-hydroxyacid dehydrogenase [unclassified Rhodococcus (in: high G+C Gram-positive bacteria)]|uniref:2-hydroxyacid dehydrogenase n=1 Tax=unclassified Rhodococcus (in: high G+C Gram-positive bacteria) TaxID=192944 RepID=UPI0006FB9DB2|nr:MULTISPECIES: 2-hydroxyacid dehydrogenase [unclassified Rhodococcus (in: high G+C Gram-positive bacteria)]KQU36456.1 hydroxyacid dehydrogenase [Rhodococcus sp. Leaf225]KQU49003.1 hydroxyacid dehydrogenase [Rhodococcus sp. Leaf258]